MTKSRRKKQSQRHADTMMVHGIITILLLTFAIITALSFFGKAGTVGMVLNEYILSALFGVMRFFVPIIALVLAWYIIADVKYDYRPTHGIGAVLFFLTTSSLIHLQFPVEEMWYHALEGNGGGIMGMGAWVMKTYLGTVASWVTLLSLMCISLLLLFNTSLMHLWDMRHKVTPSLSSVKEKLASRKDEAEEEWEEDEDEVYEDDEEYEDEEDEEEEEDPRAFASKSMNDTAEEDDEELEEEEETDLPTSDVVGESKTHTIALDPVPAWQKSAIIKPLPSIRLLETRKGKPSSGDIKENQRIIEETFREFRIEVAMEEVRVGPTVTQYAFRPAKGVKLSRITSLSNDLALALAAHPIRIEAPIPGKSLVGIEVPNNKTAMVSLRELIESKAFTGRKHDLMIGLGKDVGGKVWFADLPRMPHLLIAGSTGSGKTVCMNTIITSLLYQNTAETLRMIMVDPKRVELTLYNGIPHLLTPVITNTNKTINALKWTIEEMERRFELLSQVGNRNITTYNQQHPDTKLPHIVFIIDELADLMATASNDVEAGIIRLAQMARAVGIHLIVATQRPSVDVITGLMKANIPGRIAFSVASITDSRTILDSPGAEKLIGKGDMLLMSSDYSKPIRIQGAFISEEETKKVIKALKSGKQPTYDESVVSSQSESGTSNMFGGPTDDSDPLLHDAKKVILDAGKASASFLQRRLRVGYARAARILDELEEAGIIGPANGAKPREILVTSIEEARTMDAGGEHNVFTSPKKSIPAPEEDPDEDEEEEWEEEEDDTTPEDLEDDADYADEEGEDDEYDEEDEEDTDEEDELYEEDEEEEVEDDDDEDADKLFA